MSTFFSLQPQPAGGFDFFVGQVVLAVNARLVIPGAGACGRLGYSSLLVSIVLRNLLYLISFLGLFPLTRVIFSHRQIIKPIAFLKRMHFL